jgi:hypothetical protein
MKRIEKFQALNIIGTYATMSRHESTENKRSIKTNTDPSCR